VTAGKKQTDETVAAPLQEPERTKETKRSGDDEKLVEGRNH
jgi:hypothetical protein